MKFNWYFFEQFDPEREAGNPDNPRRIAARKADPLLQTLAEHRPGSWQLDACIAQFGSALPAQLLRADVIRSESGRLYYDCPVFLSSDALPLREQSTLWARRMADRLAEEEEALLGCCRQLKSTSSPRQALYHVLCGMVLDGALMAPLSEAGLIADSRPHPSGLDYLILLYEQCPQLEALSEGLLCSWNRLIGTRCALQSFGDSRGTRYDLYRFFRLREAGQLPAVFQRAEALFSASGLTAERLTEEAAELVTTGRCLPAAQALLEEFGYWRESSAIVPVFYPEDEAVVAQAAEVTSGALLELFSQALSTLSHLDTLTGSRHGVRASEMGNELYHILFGSLNEELVRRGIADAPCHRPGQGRFARSILLL